MPPPALTPKGKMAYNLYREYRGVDGWWNTDGDFTIEDFLGLWILFESNSAQEEIWKEQGAWIATAIAQNLYVGGWNDPTGASNNAVFNFMGSWLDGGSALHAGPDSPGVKQYNRNHSALTDHQTFLKEQGTAAMHPTQLNFDRNNAPSNWGNIEGACTIQRTLQVAGKTTGSAKYSVYYLNPSFVVLSVNQSNYWTSQGVDMSFAE